MDWPEIRPDIAHLCYLTIIAYAVREGCTALFIELGTVDVELSDCTVMVLLGHVQRHHLDCCHIFGFAFCAECIIDALPVLTGGQNRVWSIISIQEPLITDLSPV